MLATLRSVQRADLPMASTRALIRDRIREGRDDGAIPGGALRFVEVFAVVRR